MRVKGNGGMMKRGGMVRMKVVCCWKGMKLWGESGKGGLLKGDRGWKKG